MSAEDRHRWPMCGAPSAESLGHPRPAATNAKAKKARRPKRKFKPPPGSAVIRLDDLAALRAARPQQPEPQTGATWQGLAAAIGLITAQLGGQPVSFRRTAGTDAGVVDALVMLTASMCRNLLDDEGTEVLRDLGLMALEEGTR